MDFLIDVQRAIHATLSADIAGFGESRSWGALAAVLPLGIVFGAAHALTPGHSKLLLATYVAGSGAAPVRAVVTAIILTATHIASAVVLASGASWLVSRTIDSAGQAPALELISRSAVVLVGVWVVIRAVRTQPQVHGEGAAVGVAAGLIPCPLTLFLMFYAISKGVPEAGLAFAATMLLGVGAVLVAVALASAFAARFVVEASSYRGIKVQVAARAVELLAGLALVGLACIELLN
jgi:nickel/cobalt exporter